MIRALFFRMAWALERRIVPGLKSSQYAYHRRVVEALDGASVWLDVGCGHQVFGDWMMDEEKRAVSMVRHVVGTDLDFEAMRRHPNISDKVKASLESLPFPKDSFDVVTANMVVEHLSDPVTVMTEIARVLRPGGLFVFHTPNYRSPIVYWTSKIPEWFKRRMVRALQGRKDEDIFETHYRFNTGEDIKRVAGQTGFGIQWLDQVSTSAMTVMLGPVAVFFELIYLRRQQRESAADRRSNLVGVFRKKTT